MRSCGSCSAWEKMAAGSGPERTGGGGQQRCPAAAVRSGCTAGCARASGEAKDRTGCTACVRAGKEAKDRTGSTACTHTGGEAETRTAGARSGVQGRSAPLDRAGTRTKAREEAQPCTEAGCSAQARAKHPAAADWGSGAKNRSTENRKETKSPQVRWISGLWALLCHIRVGSVPV